MVGGTDRFDTRVMQRLGERVFCKVGAEGVYCAALPERGLGVAMKIDDGNNARAAEVVMAALIEAFVALDDGEAAFMRALSDLCLKNWNGIEVGALRASAALRNAAVPRLDIGNAAIAVPRVAPGSAACHIEGKVAGLSGGRHAKLPDCGDLKVGLAGPRRLNGRAENLQIPGSGRNNLRFRRRFACFYPPSERDTSQGDVNRRPGWRKYNRDARWD